MPALILPRRCIQQPQGAAEIDWQSPFAAGLEFLAVPEGSTFRDLVTNTWPDSVVGTFAERVQANEGGKSALASARTLVADGATTTGMAWPASATLRGANLYEAGTLLCLGGADVQTDAQRVFIGGNTEIVSNGNNPTLTIDSFINVGRGNIQRTTYNGGNPKTSPTALLGNPFSDRLHFFGFAFDATGTQGDFFGGTSIEAFTGATAWANASTTNRRARLFTGGATGNNKSALIAMFGMWSRRMSASEYLALYANPSQLVRMALRRLYFDMAAGGGAHDLAASGSATASGTAALSADVALAGVAVAVASGSAQIAADVALSATGISVSTGTATPAANISISAAGLAQAAASAGLSADVLLAGAAAAQAAGNAALAAQLNLLAQGAAQAGGSAELAGGASGDLAAAGSAQAAGAAALTIIVSLAAAGAAQAGGSAALEGGAAGEVSATGSAQSTGAATVSATVTLSAAGFAQAMGAGVLAVQVPLAAFGAALAAGAAELSSADALVLMRAPGFIVAASRSFRVASPRRSFRVSR